ncbi:cytoplasmic protein [Williamsia phyllosphaerae]|uniref:cytoplasmic protein n=1 Tax=Williamsia phyllosphaerae TaxID=885042 RepID=UPI001E401FAC|nr:cytoplasmic protein [Williamsia phyllosphaerae]
MFENDRVRVLEYRDGPGDISVEHHHPDSVMITLSSFDRRISVVDRSVDVTLGAGEVRWLDEQRHWGENTGDTDTHTIFVELKEAAPQAAQETRLGPSVT